MTPADWRNLLPLVGQRVIVEWVNPEDDWPAFIIIELDEEDDMIRFQGDTHPDGSKHDGNKFWVMSGDIVSIKPRQSALDRMSENAHQIGLEY